VLLQPPSSPLPPPLCFHFVSLFFRLLLATCVIIDFCFATASIRLSLDTHVPLSAFCMLYKTYGGPLFDGGPAAAVSERQVCYSLLRREYNARFTRRLLLGGAPPTTF
jgi:hypothetical protein